MASSKQELPRLSETFIYQMLNKNGSIDSIIKNFITKSTSIGKEDLIDEFGSIRRYFKYLLVPSVMDAIENGDIQARIYPPSLAKTNKVPVFLPFIVVGVGNKTLPLAVLDNHVQHSNDGTLNIDPKKLYVLLEGAYVAKELQRRFSVVNNTVIYTDGALVYAHMFARVLNKKYALNVEKSAFGKILYVATKFFFINLLRIADSSMVQNYALKISGLSAIAVKEVDEAFSEKPDTFSDLGKFLSRIAETSYLFTHGLKDLTVRNYIQGFIDMYGSSAVFALEHFSYFIFNIASAVNGGFLNNQYAFDEVIGRSGEKVYAFISTRVQE